MRNKWKTKERVIVSETECDIIRMSEKGYTMNEISEKIYKSIDTVKSCKRSLFSKLGVRNITEAVSHTINYRLF